MKKIYFRGKRILGLYDLIKEYEAVEKHGKNGETAGEERAFAKRFSCERRGRQFSVFSFVQWICSHFRKHKY